MRTDRGGLGEREPRVGAAVGEAAAKLIPQADVILGLEVTDFWGQVNQVNRNDKTSRPRLARCMPRTSNMSAKSAANDRWTSTSIATSGARRTARRC